MQGKAIRLGNEQPRFVQFLQSTYIFIVSRVIRGRCAYACTFIISIKCVTGWNQLLHLRSVSAAYVTLDPCNVFVRTSTQRRFCVRYCRPKEERRSRLRCGTRMHRALLAVVMRFTSVNHEATAAGGHNQCWNKKCLSE